MSRSRRAGRKRGLASAVALGVVLCASTALAQTPGEMASSDNIAINLIELLVKQGVISRLAADQLLKQAEVQTEEQRAANGEVANSGAAVVANAAPAPSEQAALPPPAPGVLRIPYVPEVVRDQIRDEVKAEVMQEAKDERWADPGALPEWLDKLGFSADVRLRSQYNLYSNNNIHASASQPDAGLIDYATFNSSGPTDINPAAGLTDIPYLNTNKSNYNNLSIRARFAIDAVMSNSFGAGIRIATGDTDGPVSTTSLLNGGFSKNNIWLDRAFVWFKPTDWSTFTGGRMPNPFLYTDMLFSDDLNFDGVTGKVTFAQSQRDLKYSLVAGAFPLGFQATNFPTDSAFKSSQAQHWLYAAQVGLEWDPIRFDWKLAAAYYDFDNIQGELSPCAIYLGVKQCSTDFTAPPFMQKGNSLFFIRDIEPDPSSPGDYSQPQLVGLTFPFRLFDINSRFDYRLDQDNHLIFTAEYLRNTAYDARDVCRYEPLGLPLNNIIGSAMGNTDPCDAPPSGDTKATFQSGPNAWMVSLLYGLPDPTRFGEWNVSAGYRYIQPDALPDGFNSTDFHLGGTNAKGYILTATIGLYSSAYLQIRWFSADQVYGPPLAIDVGQLDLHVRF